MPSGSIPRRLVLVLGLLFAANFLNYIDRGNLSIAAPILQQELGISPQKLGLLLSAFFWTYALLQPVAGWVVDRFDVAYVLAAGFLTWSAATAATGMVHAYATLFAVRLALGIGESVAYPSYARIIARGVSESRRGIANAVVGAGILLGPGFGIFAGGNLISKFGWRPFFVVLGLGSMVWLPMWLAAMPREPRQPAPPAPTSPAAGAITLRQFLSLRAAWGACGGHFAHNYFSYFMITWLPYYLERECGFSPYRMARVGALAYLLAAVACTSAGWLADRWIEDGGDSNFIRKFCLGGGLAASAMFLFGAAFAGRAASPAMLVLATAVFGVTSSHVFVAAQTLAGPQAAGRWTGMQNFAGNLAGPVAPALTGFLFQRTGNFTAAFAVTSAILLFGTFCWCVVLKRIEPVDWEARRPGALASRDN
ncbi:MAG: MFS transporter [Acidobacteria bacterium]|nr:MFS transporter [Acidobacteriota bacterium]